MQTRLDEVDEIKRRICVTVDAAEVKKEYDKVTQKFTKDAKIKGFRPGKAPLSVIEKMYKSEINGEVSKNIVQNSFGKALDEHKLNFVGSPIFEKINTVDSKADYQYDFLVEIYPKIENLDYKKIKVEKPDYKYTEEEIEAQIKAIQKQLSKREIVSDDTKAEEGHFIKIDYESSEDNKKVIIFEGEAQNDITIKIGQNFISEEFSKSFIGMQKGEKKEFKLIIPDSFYKKELAGKEILFKVVLKEIRKEILPEINDELAKQTGHFQSLDELKTKIRENLESGYNKRIEQEVNEQIFKGLLERVSFKTPDALIDYELNLIVNEAEQMFKAYNMTLEQAGQSEAQIRLKYKTAAEEKAKRHILLNALAKQENLEATEEDFKIYAEEASKTYNISVEEIQKIYNQEAQKEAIQGLILEKKALKLVLDNAEISEKVKE